MEHHMAEKEVVHSPRNFGRNVRHQRYNMRISNNNNFEKNRSLQRKEEDNITPFVSQPVAKYVALNTTSF